MDESDAAEVLMERLGHVMVVRLNRPNKRNALTRAMTARIVAAAEEAERDPAVRVGIIVSSTPGMFCAGADLAEVSSGVLGGDNGAPRPSFHRLERHKPWIAAVSGAVLGGGLELALACELMVAAEGAVIALPEVQRGLIAGAGGVFRLPQRAPRAVAMEMLLTGGRLPVERAYAVGIINRVVPEAQLFDSAMELATAIAACSPSAVRESLLIARQAPALSEEALWPIVADAMQRVYASDDCREGMAAYAEKREPQWTGS